MFMDFFALAHSLQIFDDLHNVYFDAPIGKNDKPNLVE